MTTTRVRRQAELDRSRGRRIPAPRVTEPDTSQGDLLVAEPTPETVPGVQLDCYSYGPIVAVLREINQAQRRTISYAKLPSTYRDKRRSEWTARWNRNLADAEADLYRALASAATVPVVTAAPSRTGAV